MYTLDPSLSLPEPRGHGLRLRAWDAGSDADAQAWLRGHLDPDFQRWNTPLKLWTDLAGARESLRARARDAADGRSASFRITDDESGATLGHIGLGEISTQLKTARVGYWVLPEARGRGVATVYTPAPLRGRGHAGAATAAVSRAALDAGAKEVLLFTDLANPTSNGLYQRLGYRAVADFAVYEFGDA
jgi:RimJ/RimL family protein N-acetyltransferase